MKNQALFSSKDKSKKIKMSSAAIFVWHCMGSFLAACCFYYCFTCLHFVCK